MRAIPARKDLTPCFAQAAYRLGDRFGLRETGIAWFEVRTLGELRARVGECNVLLVSGSWRNELITAANKLAFVQSISAGMPNVLITRGNRA